MAVHSIHISNLPRGIEDEEIPKQLRACSKEAFSSPFWDMQLTARVFRGPNKAVTAVVTGLDYNFERMLLLTRGLHIYRDDEYGFDSALVTIKADTGEPRNDDGSWLYSKNAGATRSFQMLTGGSHRKFKSIFKHSFLRDLNKNIWTGQQRNTLYLHAPDLNVDALRATPGYNYSIEGKNNTHLVHYHSSLEQLQAVALLNLNPEFNSNNNHTSHTLPQFISSDGKEKALCALKCGLGPNGELLDVAALSKTFGYIPLLYFNQKLLNFSHIKGLTSRCWKCKFPYDIIGVTLQLSTLVGLCRCVYTCVDRQSDLVEGEDQEGYHWPKELFTRLMPGLKAIKGVELYNEVIICHHPIKLYYQSPLEYRSIQLPLIEEEWQYALSAFKTGNTTNGTIQLKFVEDLKDGNLYAIKIQVPVKQKAWTPGHCKGIKAVTITWNKGFQVEANVFSMTFNEESKITVFGQTKIPYSTKLPEGTVTLVPHPSRAEYEGLRKQLNRWVQKPEKMSPLLSILLDPTRPPTSGWLLINREIGVAKNLSGFDDNGLALLQYKLNIEQEEACRNAELNAVSVIQGPPGTGKSLTVAAISTYLSTKEEGFVLVCAPSNFAADGVANTIVRISSSCFIRRKVLRIYAKSREQYHEQDNHGDDNHRFDILHKQVKKSPLWLEDGSIQDMTHIKQNVNNNTTYFLTEKQQNDLTQHITNIEDKVLDEYDIFVSTVDCLADGRWRRKLVAERISTIILDEAGQLSQTDTLHLFQFKPHRFIFAGDHLQLKANVLSYAASAAGLNLSVMDVLNWANDSISNLRTTIDGYPCAPPSITLLEQYRMHQQIRELVSKLNYNDILKDSDLVKARKPLLGYLANLDQYMKGSRVGILDHRGLENKNLDTGSYKNLTEVDRIVGFVNNLLKAGAPSTDITILTFYDAQKLAIFDALKCNNIAKKVACCNVDAFQGKENEVVIVSFVRSNLNIYQDIGFLANLNRINLALSRAKQFLIIACNFEFFKKNKIQHFKKLFQLLEKSAVLL